MPGDPEIPSFPPSPRVLWGSQSATAHSHSSHPTSPHLTDEETGSEPWTPAQNGAANEMAPGCEPESF